MPLPPPPPPTSEEEKLEVLYGKVSQMVEDQSASGLRA